MRNRAKCKLCGSVIESTELYDAVSCSCGEISIWGGPNDYRCSYSDIANFVRVDDENNEILAKEKNAIGKPTKEELLKALDEMIRNIENLPPNAMSTSINHYDFVSALTLMSLLLRSS